VDYMLTLITEMWRVNGVILLAQHAKSELLQQLNSDD